MEEIGGKKLSNEESLDEGGESEKLEAQAAGNIQQQQQQPVVGTLNNTVDNNGVDSSNCRKILLEYSASSIQRNLICLKDVPEPKRNLSVSAALGFIHKGSFLIYHIEASQNSNQIVNYSHKQSIHLSELIRLSHHHLQQQQQQHSQISSNKILSKGTVILQVNGKLQNG